MAARHRLGSPVPAIAFALLAVLCGSAIIGIATGALPYAEDKLTAPRWLIALAGSMFVAIGPAPLAGVFPRLSPLARGAGIYVGAVLLVLVHWVAFGDGERHFFSGGAPGGGVLRSPVSENLGRSWFGAIAALLDALVVWALWRSVRERAKR